MTDDRDLRTSPERIFGVDLREHRQLAMTEIDTSWQMYRRGFEQLSALAVQRHLLDRSEFEATMADDRVVKYIAWDETQDDAVAGMATLTNDLSAVPLISPEYFRDRWPDLFRDRLIWYVGFLTIAPEYRSTTVVADLIGRICAQVAATGGVVAADICEHNEQAHRLPTAFARVGRGFAPGITSWRLDAQVYWAYEFPTPV